MQDKIFDLLLEQEDVTWKSILISLVESEEMDPWDINITLLTKKYLQVVREMQEHDLRISGKIILAAAILLKIKSSYLLEKDITKLDELINQEEEEIDEEYFGELIDEVNEKKEHIKPTLIPRNPQPRDRKVSINDLVNALQRAITSKKRVLQKQRPEKFKVPERKIDIMEAIRDVYHKITFYSNKEKDLTFTRLLPPKPEKEDKVYTFIPLLHLINQKKIDTLQEDHFKDIHIKLLK